jgi:2,3-diaminopropionate biosynthesis protein SbnB
MNNQAFSVITNPVISKILETSSEKIYEIIKDIYLVHHHQKANCNSHILRFPDKPDSRIIALPSLINKPSDKIVGLKWISSNPHNVKQNMQRASAIIVLNDYETGYPFACLEGALISATRTAYSAVLAAEKMHNGEKKINSLGFIGTGYISKNVYDCFSKLNWLIDKINLYDIDHERATSFAKTLENQDKNVCIHNEIDTAISQSDVIVFCTTALTPHINNIDLFKHNPKVLHISLRDLSPNIILNAENIVDDVDHILSANTSPHLALQKQGSRNFIKGTIGGILNNEFSLSKEVTLIYSPMGLGVLDIALANYVYKECNKNNSAIKIENFFNNS